MRKTTILLAMTALTGLATLSACSKSAPDQTNVVEMNAMDGSMNDMTVVDSATLEAAGSGNAQNDATADTVSGNAANAM